MSGFKHQYFDAGRTLSAINQPGYAIGRADTKHVHGLRYSSARPWILALAVGITVWGFFAWLISGYL
jgi:hypothetical protein